MMATQHFYPSDEDKEVAQNFLRDHKDPLVPGKVGAVISEILTEVAEGRSFEITKSRPEIWTTQQAANFLGVSRTYLVKLLEQGDIPFHMVGSQRRVERAQIEQYDLSRKAKAKSDLARMVREEQELGLYD